MTIRTQYQLDQMAAAESRLISMGVLSPPKRTSRDDEWWEAVTRACKNGTSLNSELGLEQPSISSPGGQDPR